MFDEELTLDIFVCSISICQPEADLGSILNIFQSNDCQLLAIPLENSTWGTISSQSILSLLAKMWQREGVAMVGHPKNLVCEERASQLESQDFSHLIKPATVYPSRTKLQTFLGNLDRNSLSECNQEYLITNELGKLQGRLDPLAILKYLASETNRHQVVNSKKSANVDSLCKLLDSVTLPLKIETTTGQDLYANRCWQKSIATTQGIKSQQLLPDKEIASWWIEQQSGENQRVFEEAQHNQADQLPLTCCSTVFPLELPFQTNLLGLTEESFPLVPDSQEKKSNGDRFILTANSKFNIHIEQKQDCYQIKIPLALIDHRAFPPTESLYWLVLSAQGLTKEDSVTKPLEPKPTVSKTVLKELLGTISHELKSPITGIVGLSSLLQDRRIGQLNQRQTRYTHLIANSGQKLMGIVNDLLELVSLTNGQSEPKPESINLKLLFRQLYQQTLEKLQLNSTGESDLTFLGTQLSLEIEPGLEIAFSDRLRLSAILSYLLLETFQFADLNNDTVVITIKQDFSQEHPCQGQRTKIIFKNRVNPHSLSASFAQDSTAVKKSSGWNLILAKYLGQVIQADVWSSYSTDGCRLTLLLPVTNAHQRKPLSESSPAVVKQQDNQQANITILCLYPEFEVIEPICDRHSGLDFNLKNWAEQDWSKMSEQQPHYQHRIIEADGLEQAHTLARIWQLDVIVLDGYQIVEPTKYLRSLQESKYLSTLPLVTLDTRTTEAANQIEGLNVYPCLLPAECRSIEDLIQVIQIATGV